MHNASSWSSGYNVGLWRQPSGFESYLGLIFFCKQDTKPVFFLTSKLERVTTAERGQAERGPKISSCKNAII